MGMFFGEAPTELMAGAKNAVDVCLGVQKGEHVALIADEVSRSVAASLENALGQRGAVSTGLLLEDFGPRPMKGAPELVLETLETADVGMLCMTPQPGELTARMSIVRVVERRQIRYAHMVGVTPQIMQQGMRADYRMVDRLSDKLRERMLRAETLTVKTEAGTSISAHFDRGLDWVKTSGLISPRYWSNLPAGEVFTTPATVDGQFVCDATAGDYFNGKYGDLQDTPLMLKIAGGAAGGGGMRAEGSGAGVLGVLPHGREQRSRGGAGVRHESGIDGDDWNFAAGREISRGAYCVWRSVREPDARGLEIDGRMWMC